MSVHYIFFILGITNQFLNTLAQFRCAVNFPNVCHVSEDIHALYMSSN